MKIEVVSIEDQEDGSAIVVFDIDKEARDAFIRAGIMSALIKVLEQAEKFKGETE